MRLSKPYTKIGATPLDESTLSTEEAEIYHVFHTTIGKKHITRMSRSVRNSVPWSLQSSNAAMGSDLERQISSGSGSAVETTPANEITPRSRAHNVRQGLRTRLANSPKTDSTAKQLEKKIENLLTEFSQTQPPPPLPALPDATSSNPNNRRTNGYFESIHEDVNMLDATSFREWRTICNESLGELLKGMQKPPEPQQQLVLLQDGSLALQDGINVTKIDRTTLPKITTPETPNYVNTQITVLPPVPPPPTAAVATDLSATNQQIVDYTLDKNVAENSMLCHEEWLAQYGSNN